MSAVWRFYFQRRRSDLCEAIASMGIGGRALIPTVCVPCYA